MSKINIQMLRNLKKDKLPTVWVTAYDYPQARIADSANIDVILVGDSAGNTTHGFKNTIPVTMEMMLLHSAAVARGTHHSFLIGDMPYMSYQVSISEAIRNAGKFIQTGMDAVKLEGDLPEVVSAIDKAGILVCGHLGLTPQSTAHFGGYKVQGKDKNSASLVLEQAIRLQDAGASLLLLEAMPPDPAGKIADRLSIPVYGIGAGNKVDGQLIILHDLLGLSFEFTCKFVKKYVDGESIFTEALKQYAQEVREHQFPSQQHFYVEDHK